MDSKNKATFGGLLANIMENLTDLRNGIFKDEDSVNGLIDETISMVKKYEVSEYIYDIIKDEEQPKIERLLKNSDIVKQIMINNTEGYLRALYNRRNELLYFRNTS